MTKESINSKSHSSAFHVPFLHSNSVVLFSRDRYIKGISIICTCTFRKTIEDLTEEIGEELAREMLIVRDIIPEVWTPALEIELDRS